MLHKMSASLAFLIAILALIPQPALVAIQALFTIQTMEQHFAHQIVLITISIILILPPVMPAILPVEIAQILTQLTAPPAHQ